MKKLISSFLLVLLLCSPAIAEEFIYLNKGIYTKDQMSLELAVSAMWDENYEKLARLQQMNMIYLNESEKEISIVEKVSPKEALVELPSTMVVFKFKDDYRKYYTIDHFTTRILR